MPSWTPELEVDALLMELLQGVRSILGPRLLGVYLHGSLAGGGFDQDSDVDVVAVTEGDLSADDFAELDALHQQLSARDTPWAEELEVSYIPRDALRRYDPARARHPHIDRDPGERLHWMFHDRDWVIQRHTLRQQGITLMGPPPQQWVDPVSPDDLRGAARAMLNGWIAKLLHDPSEMRDRGWQSFVVLTLCRILHTLHTGTVVSKAESARWAEASAAPQWASLIEEAWIGRRNPRWPVTPQQVQATQAMIRDVLQRTGIAPTSVSSG